MDGRKKATTRLLSALAAAGCLACASAPPAAKERAAKPGAAQPAAAGEAAPPAAPADGAVSAPVRDDELIVVEPGDDDEESPKSLVEAAKAERERRAQATPPAISVNDANLAEYARKGQITFAEPGSAPPAAAAPSQPGSQEGTSGEASPTEALLATEDYWRQGVLDRRVAWRQAYDEIKRLEQEAAELRQKFYLEDDTFRRDTQIKPDWDRVLDRLQRVRNEETQAQQALTDFLEQGQRAGALPGWLREGIDLEPVAEKPKKAIAPLKSIEPPTIEPAAIPPPRDGAP